MWGKKKLKMPKSAEKQQQQKNSFCDIWLGSIVLLDRRSSVTTVIYHFSISHFFITKIFNWKHLHKAEDVLEQIFSVKNQC